MLLSCLFLTSCGKPVAPTPPADSPRLPTRLPPVTPTPLPTVIPAEAYVEQGGEWRQLDETAKARQCFNWAVERDPAFAPAYLARGSLLLAKGELAQALLDAETALGLDPTPRAHLLRAEVLRQMERYEPAWTAFDEVLELAPALREDTFHSRWLVARATEETDRLSALAAEYAAAHPAHALRHYFAAWAALGSGEPEEAISLLVGGIEQGGQQSAVLWYLLGQSYLEIEAWPEAVLSLETARALLEAGDSTLAVHGSRAIADLFVALGRAYLGAGRCADAEAMLAHGLSIGAEMSEHLHALEEARICQTGTPGPDSTVAPAGD